jgi:sialate O-acetylesterase
MKHARLLTCAIAALISLNVNADVKLPAIFGSHMVLQRGIKLPVWGWADAGEKVTVKIASQEKSATADEKGVWRVTLDPIESNAPIEMSIAGKNTVTLSDILIGDVWLCSGQSNMEWPTVAAKDGPDEVAKADHPTIRLFHVDHAAFELPQQDVKGKWELCSPKSVPQFSAVGYFFGRELNQKLNVPIGLIESSWGGTPAESWTPRQSLKDAPPKLGHILATYEKNVADYPEAKKKWEAAMQEWKKRVELDDTGNQGVEKGFAKVDFDDSAWKPYPVPSMWEHSLKLNKDGALWFRKTVEISDGWAGKDLELKLGKLDDTDVTYFNGEQVGATEGELACFVDRAYKVPAKLVKAGKNTIAVRIFDRRGDGGWAGPAENITLAAKESVSDSTKPISLAGEWKYEIEFALDPKPFTWSPGEPQHPDYAWSPSNLYNGMIHPIVPFGIRGAIWYQGESNANEFADEYADLLGAMIKGWRSNWNQGDFPFLIVQLANFTKEQSEPVQTQAKWPVIRECQYQLTRTLPNVGMASASDIGEAGDIHPKNKQEVGRRLALSAEQITYDMNVVHIGPTFKSVSIDGDKAIVTFTNIGGGLEAKGDALKGFAIAGPDGKWHYANAKIDGDHVVLTSSDVHEPKSVAYGWADNPVCNLFNKEGLPAVPFMAK